MKFIFPQNYNFKSKIFGFIDYSTAILNIIWGIILLGIINIFHLSFNVKFFLFVVLFFPIFLFSVVGFNGEGILNVCCYLYKYMVKPKVLLYKK